MLYTDTVLLMIAVLEIINVIVESLFVDLISYGLKWLKAVMLCVASYTPNNTFWIKV